MSGLFGGGGSAPMKAPEPPPTVATPAVQAAADSARMRERRASGRASTMLTSQEDYSAPRVATSKLLGGG